MELEKQNYVMEVVLFELKEGIDKHRFCQAAAALCYIHSMKINGRTSYIGVIWIVLEVLWRS